MYGSLGITRYKSLKSIIEGIEKTEKEELQEQRERVEKNLSTAEDRQRKAQDGSRSISEAASSTLQMRELVPLEEREVQEKLVAHALGGRSNFIHVYSGISTGVLQAWKMLQEICAAFQVEDLIGFSEEERSNVSREQIHDLSAEYQLNQHACEGFVDACMKLMNFRWQLLNMSQQIVSVTDDYNKALAERHSSGGMRIWHSPIMTDFAIAIYDNIAYHGEVSKSSHDTEISAYSLRKAEAIISWIKDEHFRDILMSETSSFTTMFKRQLWDLWKISTRLEEVFGAQLKRVAALYYKAWRQPSQSSFDRWMADLEDVDPNRVKFRDMSASMTEEERKDLSFKNEAINKICRMLRDDDVAPHKIAREVWEEVKKLKFHYLEVNSFYVCRIAQGNPMSGKSNGQLEVIPGKKPNANFDKIVGSGFDEVRAFVKHIERLRKYAPLYLMTSPRKQVDKANILLIGPMGCGKTECMRAICNEEECIAIFAAGSDFLTAWMGEAQKNPKRLFEAAVKLQKESGRHVHILIDEIDEVLNNDRSTTNINLSLEFQMIMDGIVEYPNISVWGATNNPERIPMPMIRRFSKVLIVGKLDQKQRIALLKQFLGTMPLSKGFTKKKWEEWARRLENATGDVVRKICDHVWRSEISRFIEENPDDADKMLRVISKLSYDPSSGPTGSMEARKADEEVDETHLGGQKTSRRKKFLGEFRRVFEVGPGVVDEAVDIALENIGIVNEINTAKQTYESAEAFLAAIRKEREGAKGKDGHAN